MLEAPFVRAVESLMGTGVLGSILIFFVYLYLREHRRVEERNKERDSEVSELHRVYGDKLDEMAERLLSISEKCAVAITQNTEVLKNMREMSERVLFEFARSKVTPHTEE